LISKNSRDTEVHLLSDELNGTLVSLVNLIIPADEARALPAASEVGCARHVQKSEDLGWMREGLSVLADASREQFGRELWLLTGPEQERLLKGLRRVLARFFMRLSQGVVECYYQNDRVLECIGVPARPPFPEGYLVEDGDLTLLGPVDERGKIYRD
jgi:hypothetical protein